MPHKNILSNNNNNVSKQTSPMSVVWQCKPVFGWRLRKRRSEPPYGRYGLGWTSRFLPDEEWLRRLRWTNHSEVFQHAPAGQCLSPLHDLHSPALCQMSTVTSHKHCKIVSFLPHTLWFWFLTQNVSMLKL